MIQALRDRWRSWRAAWPHPMWAGFMRRTWRIKITAAGTSTALAWGAWAIAEATPSSGQSINTLLVGVLASLAALVVVLANALGKTVTQLGEHIPRARPRNGEDAPVPFPSAGALYEVLAGDPWRREIATKIEGLRLADAGLASEVHNLGRQWAAGRSEDQAKAEKLIEDRHVLAMGFLTTAVEDIETRLGNRVEKRVGECMDTLKAQIGNVVTDAVRNALKPGGGA